MDRNAGSGGWKRTLEPAVLASTSKPMSIITFITLGKRAQISGDSTHLDEVIPLHWWPAFLRALIRTQDLRQKPAALPIHVLEPRAEVPLLLLLVLRCVRHSLPRTAETREEAPLSVLFLYWREARRLRARLDLHLLLRQVLRLQVRMGRLCAGLFQRSGGHARKARRRARCQIRLAHSWLTFLRFLFLSLRRRRGSWWEFHYERRRRYNR